MTSWNRTFALLCALTLSVAAAPAVQAADEGPFYVSVSGMWVIPGDSDTSDSSEDGADNTLDVRGTWEFEDSFGFAAAFGYGELTGLRGEVEVSYRTLDLDKLASVSVHLNDALIAAGEVDRDVLDAEIDTWSVMANGIYAFEAMSFRPYVGAGIGFAQHDATVPAQTISVPDPDDVNATLDFPIPGASDDDTVFAWQLMAGVGYAVSDSTEIRLGYRYFDTADAEFDGITEDISYDTHNVELGIVHCF